MGWSGIGAVEVWPGQTGEMGQLREVAAVGPALFADGLRWDERDALAI